MDPIRKYRNHETQITYHGLKYFDPDLFLSHNLRNNESEFGLSRKTTKRHLE